MDKHTCDGSVHHSDRDCWLKYHLPTLSMYGLFTYVWLNLDVYVGKCTIRGSYGYLDTWTSVAVNKIMQNHFPAKMLGTSSINKELQCCLLFFANNTHTLRKKKFQRAQAFWIDELRLKRIYVSTPPPKFNIAPEKWWLENYFPIV